MALRTLRIDGDEILRKKSRVVEKIDEKVIQLLDDMKETMRQNDGVGLAAVQVGVLKRIFVIEIEDVYLEFINPEIISFEDEQINQEACLSVPGEAGFVKRPYEVVMKALNRDGEEIEVKGEDFLAIAMCHEYDHLDGILYKDKVLSDEEIAELDIELE